MAGLSLGVWGSPRRPSGQFSDLRGGKTGVQRRCHGGWEMEEAWGRSESESSRQHRGWCSGPTMGLSLKTTRWMNDPFSLTQLAKRIELGLRLWTQTGQFTLGFLWLTLLRSLMEVAGSLVPPNWPSPPPQHPRGLGRVQLPSPPRLGLVGTCLPCPPDLDG